MSVSVNVLRCFLFLALASVTTVPVHAQEEGAEKLNYVTVLEPNLFLIDSDGIGPIAAEMLERLPKEIRQNIKAALDQNGIEINRKAASDIKLDSVDLKKYIEVSTQGKITIIGPDGKATTRDISLAEFGDEDFLMKTIRGALGDGNQLSEEAMNRIAKAIEAQKTGALKDISVGQTVDSEPTAEQPSNLSKVLEKLDSIASRLEQIEAKVERLYESK